MMEDLMATLLFAIIYTVIGIIFNKLTYDYVRELEEKTRKVDARFANDLYIHIRTKTKFQEKLVSFCWLLFWPATDIAAILKAEDTFSRVKNHVNYYRAR